MRSRACVIRACVRACVCVCVYLDVPCLRSLADTYVHAVYMKHDDHNINATQTNIGSINMIRLRIIGKLINTIYPMGV